MSDPRDHKDALQKLAEARDIFQQQRANLNKVREVWPSAHAGTAQLLDAGEVLIAELTRLQAGGCARDQGLTQFCAEAVERDATIKALRARIVYLEAGLDAIARVNDGNGRCLSTCASNANPDADCDCGYCAAEEPGPFAADVVAGEANLYGALRLDKIVDDYLDSACATLPTDRSPK